MNDWSAQLDTTPIYLAQAHETSVAQTTSTQTPSEPVGGASEEHEAPQSLFFSYSLLALVLIVLLAILGTRRMRLVPRGLQNGVEWIFESLYGIPEMVMGSRGRQYAPFVVTFFMYIFVMNLTGLIPPFKSGTASLSVTLGLAIVAFFAVQYFGFKTHGVRYLAHFLGPVPFMAVLILPLEIIAELVRPVSLSVRLYGNIFGEEQVISALSTQLSPYAAVFMLPLQVLTVFLQAFVFTLLVTVYISLATEKHDEGHGAAEAASH